MKRIQVAVGVVEKEGKVLIGQRTVTDRYYQKWEFPGGKLEDDETPLDALKRELHEELDIHVCSAYPLIYIEHDYPDRHVSLHVYCVDRFTGTPKGAEGQNLQWVIPSKCKEVDFLQANEPIVNAVSLPSQIFITDIKQFGLDKTLRILSDKVDELQRYSGCRSQNFAVQLRENDAPIDQLKHYFDAIRSVCGDQLVFLNGDPVMAQNIGFDGVQLNSHRAKKINSRSQLPDFWVGVSCHNLTELTHADNISDFAMLSPVNSTKSHQGQSGLGWDKFTSLTHKLALPCYALGGMSLEDVDLSREHGAQGIAAISSVWSE